MSGLFCLILGKVKAKNSHIPPFFPRLGEKLLEEVFAPNGRPAITTVYV